MNTAQSDKESASQVVEGNVVADNAEPETDTEFEANRSFLSAFGECSFWSADSEFSNWSGRSSTDSPMDISPDRPVRKVDTRQQEEAKFQQVKCHYQ